MSASVEPEAPEPDPEELDRALLTRLDLEHEAVWLMGAVGGRVESLRERARDAYVDHRTARDRLLRSLEERSAPTSAAQASYGAPPSDRDAAETAVVDLQRRITAACLAIAAASPVEARERALVDLREAALTTLSWGGSPEAFPGLD